MEANYSGNLFMASMDDKTLPHEIRSIYCIEILQRMCLKTESRYNKKQLNFSGLCLYKTDGLNGCDKIQTGRSRIDSCDHDHS